MLGFHPERTVSDMIPESVRIGAGWWSQGKISDEDFLEGIALISRLGIIDLPSPQPNKSVSVPDWVRSSAGWWSQGKISGGEFLEGMEYLMQASSYRAHKRMTIHQTPDSGWLARHT